MYMYIYIYSYVGLCNISIFISIEVFLKISYQGIRISINTKSIEKIYKIAIKFDHNNTTTH